MGPRAARVAVLATVMSCGMSASTTALAGEPEHPLSPSSRREPSPSGLRVGLRSGYAIPIGTAFTTSGAMNETMVGYVPLRLDIGYRIADHFYVGGNAQLAAILSTACPSGATCSGTDTRIGVMAAFHLRPKRIVDPWIGLGMGFEWLSTSRTVDGMTVDINARGLELVDVELGMDVRPAGVFRIGPVLSGSVGRFARIAVNGTETTDFTASLHSWVMLGVRGAFDM
jgi:hypothetical protein